MGPLCAAVVAAAVLLPVDLDPARLAGVRDSKTIGSPQVREELALLVRSVAEKVGVGAASPGDIERLNIRRATALAMRRALNRIGPHDHVLIDGNPMREFDRSRHTFIVDGDALCLSIAAASIVAKVTRDRLMARLAARYPGHGWGHNAGYGTPAPLEALRRLGPTRHHRMLFGPLLQPRMDFGDLVPAVTETDEESAAFVKADA